MFVRRVGCEMAGLPVPASVQFSSIVPLITGIAKARETALYAAYLKVQRAVRTEDWKLIRTSSEGQVQLFRIRKDPWEQHNLAADPKYAEVVERLDQQLRELMVLNQDPMSPREVFGRE